MRSKMGAIFVGALLLAAAPVALAKTNAMEHRFTGEVSQLDSTGKTLAVKDHASKTPKEMTFSLAPNAKIMQGSKAKHLKDLKVGERVQVAYVDEGSAHKAKRIDVLPPRSAKANSWKPSKTESKSGY